MTLYCFWTLVLGVAIVLLSVDAHSSVLPAPQDTFVAESHHATASTLTPSNERDGITFTDHGSVGYVPGEVVAAEDRGGSGSGIQDVAFDANASLNDILGYFANISKLPAQVPSTPEVPHLIEENSTVSNSSSQGSASDDITIPISPAIVPNKTQVSVFDPSEADKPLLPAPTVPASPTPQPAAPLKSGAMVSKMCDAAFFAIMMFVLAFQ